jgi:serine protease Do
MDFRVISAVVMATALSAPIASAQAQQPGRSEQTRMPRAGGVSMIGVQVGDVTADNMKSLKVSRLEGAVVERVNPNGPASAAGLREQDVIVAFDGERVRSASQLSRLVSETPAEREVSMSIIRDGRRSDLRIKPEAGGWVTPRLGGMINQDDIREYAEEASRVAREMGRNLPGAMEGMRARVGARGRLGATVQELTPELASYFGVKSGVLIAGVATDSPAAKAGMKAGDVITAVDGRPIGAAADLVRALPRDDESREVTLTIVREKKEQTVKATIALPERAQPPARRGRSV